jgi:hypothetical protein
MFVLSWRFSLELMFDEKLSVLGNEAGLLLLPPVLKHEACQRAANPRQGW